MNDSPQHENSVPNFDLDIYSNLISNPFDP
jgi:hypothetical protein